MNTVRINTLIKNEQFLLTDLKKFVGKRVDIFISEAKNNSQNTKKWQFSGALDLKGMLDEKNIRDLAYE